MWALEDIAVEFTEEPEDTLVFVRFLTPDGEIHACGELELRGRVLIVHGLHMHG